MTTSNLSILSGASLFTDTSNADTAVAVKASSASIYQLELDNTANAAATYMRMYNTTSVTVGTTVPDALYMVPPATKITMTYPEGVVWDTAVTISSGSSSVLGTTTAPVSAFAVRIVYV